MSRPGHTVEDITARPQSTTVKLDWTQVENAPERINLTPQVEEKASEWNYTNEDGHGIRVKAIEADPFDSVQKQEQHMLDLTGTSQKDVVIRHDYDDLSDDEKAAVDRHNFEAAGGLSINPEGVAKAKEFADNTRDRWTIDPEHHERVKAQKKRRQSDIQFDTSRFRTNKPKFE